jgi:hypothetical protein
MCVERYSWTVFVYKVTSTIDVSPIGVLSGSWQVSAMFIYWYVTDLHILQTFYAWRDSWRTVVNIRGWMQMGFTPYDLFFWNKYDISIYIIK